MKRKFNSLSLFMAILICLTLIASPLSAFEYNTISDKSVAKNETVTNEYLAFKVASSKTDAQLRQAGLSESEIKELRGIDFFAELESRALFSASFLEAIGYSIEQIALLKTVFGPQSNATYSQKDATAARVSANVSATMTLYLSTTSATGSYSWSTDVPFVQNKGLNFAVGLMATNQNHNLCAVSVSTNSMVITNYKLNASGASEYRSTASASVVTDNMAYHKGISVAAFDSGFLNEGAYSADFPKSGIMTFSYTPLLSTDSFARAYIEGECAYYLSGFIITPSISLLTGLDLTISWSSYTAKVAQASALKVLY